MRFGVADASAVDANTSLASRWCHSDRPVRLTRWRVGFGVDPGRFDGARRRPCGRRRLELDQKRTAALEKRRHRTPGHVGQPIPQEERAGVVALRNPSSPISKTPTSPGRTEPVLHGSKESKRVVAVTLKGEDSVNQMLQRPGAGQIGRPWSHDPPPRPPPHCALGQGGQPVDTGPDLTQ